MGTLPLKDHPVFSTMTRGRATSSPDPHREFSSPLSGDEDDFSPPPHSFAGDPEEEKSSASADEAREHEQQLRRYLGHPRSSRLLTAPEEVSLAHRVARGDQSAKDILIESNLRLVISVARRYSVPGVALADLIQEGTIGLIRAVEKYDPDRGFRFSTYATWWIRRSIARAVINQGRTIRIPVYVADMIHKISRTTGSLRQELAREPSLEEIAAAVAMPPERVDEILRAASEPLSLEAPIGDRESSQLGDFLQAQSTPTPSDVAMNLIRREELEGVLSQLSDREREVLSMRFGLEGEAPCTLEEVGQQLHVTRERVRQIELRAIKKLRRLGPQEKF
ncbi:sigma-70 family RNA polymerase sigma factor [Armatimonas sp.]|uniref:sigma-70 family RNA polymerase sigma factor n=2 Tax=Armatimonas sp. TaxID=1872638 RepID=UPI00286AD152|nr:sigma-70 family RNA polymerase sigma factor [Armatimonas sp.]